MTGQFSTTYLHSTTVSTPLQSSRVSFLASLQRARGRCRTFQRFYRDGAFIRNGSGQTVGQPRAIRDINDIEVTDVNGARTTILEFLRATDTDAFIVLHKGQVITEQYFNGMTRHTLHALFSAGKTLTATCAYILMHERQIPSFAEIHDYLPELVESAYKGATLNDALTMGTGVAIMGEPDQLPPFLEKQRNLTNRAKRLLAGANLWLIATGLYGKESSDAKGQLEVVRAAALDHPHGQCMFYKESDPWVVMRVMEAVTGEAYPDLFSHLIWSQLNAISDAWIMCDPNGSPYPAGGFASTACDLAEFGFLFTNTGRNRNGHQVIPESVVDLLTAYSRDPMFFDDEQAQFPPDQFHPERRENFGYRAYFSLHPEFITASGAFGQFCQICPTRDTVIVKLSSADTNAPRFREGALAEAQREELILNEISRAIVR